MSIDENRESKSKGESIIRYCPQKAESDRVALEEASRMVEQQLPIIARRRIAPKERLRKSAPWTAPNASQRKSNPAREAPSTSLPSDGKTVPNGMPDKISAKARRKKARKKQRAEAESRWHRVADERAKKRRAERHKREEVARASTGARTTRLSEMSPTDPRSVRIRSALSNLLGHRW